MASFQTIIPPTPPIPGAPTAVPNSDLAGATNIFNAGQVEDFYTRNLPGYSANRTQQSGVIGQQLQGQVPTDVVTQIIQQAAERGISTGLSGSPNESSALLRALGLTSIGQQQQGMQNLDRSINQTPVPELFAPQSLFVPQMLAQQELDAARAGQRQQETAARDAATRARQTPMINWGGGPSGGGMPNLRSPTAQYNNIPAFMGGGSGSQFNSPVIGGSNNVGSASFWGGGGSYLGGGAQGPTSTAASPWSMNQGAGGAWLGGGAQGPTQGGSMYMGSAAGAPGAQPSMTDQQWEDSFWY